MTLLREGLYQQAYVTRNLAKALATFRQIADARLVIEHDAEIPVQTASGLRQMHCRLAFVWVGDVQYELIEPVAGAVEFYRDALPGDDALRFHHLCMRVADWDAFRAGLDEARHPVVIEGEAGPLKFLYVDARPELGHFLEYTYMPEEVWAASGGR